MATDATLGTEMNLFGDGFALVAGCDEVGRGSLAGPVTVGAVLVDRSTEDIAGLRDSKLLSAKRREELALVIPRWCVSHAVGVVPASEIDQIGMAAALRLAVSRALAGLQRRPDAVIVDGPVNLAGDAYHVLAFPKADMIASSVAAASVMAKVHRDAYMTQMDEQYPGYGFAGHKGWLRGTQGRVA